MAVTRLTFFKLAEVILAVILFFLHYQTFEDRNGIFRLFWLATTYGGFAIIIIGVFLGHILGTPVHKNIGLFYLIVGVILYFVSGYYSYEEFHGWAFNTSHANLGLTKAVLSVIQGVIFLADGFFTFNGE